MQTYSKFRPTGFDVAGLGCDDKQDWLVAIGVNRDSDCLTRSNWEVVTEDIAKHGANDSEVCEFGHWACGWFRVMLVRPDTAAAACAEEWENALSDYPVASENHFSDLEHTETCDWWAQMSLRERVRLCREAKESIFAARRDTPPDRVYDQLRESL